MTSPAAVKEMKQLMEHQRELRSWIIDVNRRIYGLEEQYLEDTPNGNIIRGWSELVTNNRKGFDEKERLFSYSSYSVFLDAQSGNYPVASSDNCNNKKKKMKKSNSSDDF